MSLETVDKTTLQILLTAELASHPLAEAVREVEAQLQAHYRLEQRRHQRRLHT